MLMHQPKTTIAYLSIPYEFVCFCKTIDWISVLADGILTHVINKL